MDTIQKFERFNTDVYNRGQGCGAEKKISKERGFDYVLSEAIRLKAHIIVEPTGKYYYIKAYKGVKSFENIHCFNEYSLILKLNNCLIIIALYI